MWGFARGGATLPRELQVLYGVGYLKGCKDEILSYWRVEYLANWLVIDVGVTLILRKAVAAMHIIAMILYWRYLNLANEQKIAK